ncbi:MAG: hypothetical protein ABI579_09315 [Candidatus Sumerlaeota bacterium]
MIPRVMLATLAVTALLLGGSGCKKKFEIRDVDPDKPGVVRDLGPESQDIFSISDTMVRSILATPEVANRAKKPTIVMLPMVNNTSHTFNQEVFTSTMKANLNKQAKDRLIFVSRDINPDILKEREMKRQGQVDYDADLRAVAPLGADFFLKGRADGLDNVSTKGRASTIVYTFKLVDAETGMDVWEDIYRTKREGKDDVIYR